MHKFMFYYLKGYGPFWLLGVAIWGGLVLPFWHPRKSFWHLGSTPWNHFGTSGPPWRTEVVRNRICIDFGVILRPVYIIFLRSRSLKFHFVSGLFPGHFFYRFLSWDFDAGDSKIEVYLRKESLAKIDLSLKSFFMNSGVDFSLFWGALEPFFCFLCLENKLEK